MWLKQIAQRKLESRVTFALCNPDIFEQQTYIFFFLQIKIDKIPAKWSKRSWPQGKFLKQSSRKLRLLFCSNGRPSQFCDMPNKKTWLVWIKPAAVHRNNFGNSDKPNHLKADIKKTSTTLQNTNLISQNLTWFQVLENTNNTVCSAIQ